ncbi:hypothetical protein EV702DRAFT_1193628 [Suillus placidus]|uniref:Uncharacterized protein n=1 Tax=Suillus placidus TaxID=48579 RepID=A0A9P7A1P8_9AGAM|nr:hypothetical protein EV702DRAFT_1193628 [Suillus placidus]
MRVDPEGQFSTASAETAATTVSLSTPALPTPKAKSKPKETEEPKTTTKPKPIPCNLMRNPSMFGPELLCPQATPSPLSRIPLSSPIGSPVAVSVVTVSPSTPSMSLSTPATPLLATQTRPHTLHRATRRIEFGSLRAASPVLSGESGTVALGSAFSLLDFTFDHLVTLQVLLSSWCYFSLPISGLHLLPSSHEGFQMRPHRDSAPMVVLSCSLDRADSGTSSWPATGTSSALTLRVRWNTALEMSNWMLAHAVKTASSLKNTTDIIQQGHKLLREPLKKFHCPVLIRTIRALVSDKLKGLPCFGRQEFANLAAKANGLFEWDILHANTLGNAIVGT